MPLRILLVHNRYRFSGGEDSVVETEAAVLRHGGCIVRGYFESNDAAFTPLDAARLLWSIESVRKLTSVLQEFRPDVVHCHNIYYRITPSAYWTCYRAGIPVIQTLHNFRFGCIGARLNRDGAPCELCVQAGSSRIPGVVRRCFQGSRIKSLALTLSNHVHHHMGSFSVAVDRFIALSECARSKHIRSGIPPGKLVVKPNCVYPDPGVKHVLGSFCLFAGRLETDKGLGVLMEAASLVPDIPFVIAGQGPLENELRRNRPANVRYLGALPRAQILSLMKQARLLVFPSLAYENFPMTIAEAFASGLPVVASKRGAAEEVVKDRDNGLHFVPGSAASLAHRIREAWSSEQMLLRMSASARAVYELKYSGACTRQVLNELYEDALSRSRSRWQRAL